MAEGARLLLDITATESSDLKTGIQRVTLELYRWLVKLLPSHITPVPVYLKLTDTGWQHWQANAFAHRIQRSSDQPLPDCRIEPSAQDCLLHLDLATMPVALAREQGLYASYRERGAHIGSIVYDLLPIQLPECFPADMEQHHKLWLAALATFDAALCISADVAKALEQWLIEHKHVTHRLSVDVFKLGSDIGTFGNTPGLSHKTYRRPKRFGTEHAKTFLMVGTIEPRKGYDEVLDAFETLWHNHIDCRLIIVGREGWQHLPLAKQAPVTSLVRRLEHHPQRYRKLVWLSRADDNALELAYEQADCLLAASLGEGFGLPIIEAARRNVPVLARDIAVFREAAPTGTLFFSSDTLVDHLANWRPLAGVQKQTPVTVTWQDSATAVMTWLNRSGLIDTTQEPRDV